MNKDELSRRFHELQENPDLAKIASLALSMIHDAKSVSVEDCGDKTSVEKQSVLQTYRIRQKHLDKAANTIRGFKETVAALEKVESARVNIIIALVDTQTWTILAQPDGSFIGCYFGKEAESTSKK